MADREKVIKAIKCRKNATKRFANPCERTGGCAYAACIRVPDGEPYYPFYCDVERLCDDTIALLMEKPKRESRAMLPCKCGCKRREHWLSASSEKPEGLKCMKCGFEVWGTNQTDVIRQWNKAVQEVRGDG